MRRIVGLRYANMVRDRGEKCKRTSRVSFGSLGVVIYIALRIMKYGGVVRAVLCKCVVFFLLVGFLILCVGCLVMSFVTFYKLAFCNYSYQYIGLTEDGNVIY